MLIEVIGPSGAGKSTFVNQLDEAGVPSLIIARDLIVDFFKLTWIQSPGVKNLLLTVCLLPWSICFSFTNMSFSNLAIRLIRRNSSGTLNFLSRIRAFIRVCGEYQFIKNSRLGDAFVILEESLIGGAHLTCVSASDEPISEDIDSYLSFLPIREFIFIEAEEVLLIEAVESREDKPLRCSSLEDNINFVSNAFKVFQRIRQELTKRGTLLSVPREADYKSLIENGLLDKFRA